MIHWNFYHSTYNIFPIMSLTMIGLDPGLLVRTIFLFAMMNPLVVLVNPLVVFVAWGLVFLSQQ